MMMGAALREHLGGISGGAAGYARTLASMRLMRCLAKCSTCWSAVPSFPLSHTSKHACSASGWPTQPACLAKSAVQ